MALRMIYAYQEWPYRQVFKFARETRKTAPQFLVHVSDGTHIGRGECGVQSLKNETRDSVSAQLQDMRERISELGTRLALNSNIPACSARNGVDAALWDLECKRTGKSVWELTGLHRLDRLEVDITIGINSAEKMRIDAEAAISRGYRHLKLKADANSVVERVSAIRSVAPQASFIIDANEAWSLEQLTVLAPDLQAMNVILIEQPLHHERDDQLEAYDCPIPLCADESCCTREDLPALSKRYDAVNIKLDKTGGLTEALALAHDAKRLGLKLMVGCNGATSLGNAPAYVVGTVCDWRDIDSQELLAEDRAGGMVTRNGELFVFDSNFWG